MAIPSGSGTEVLKRITLHENNGETEILSGAPLHIYTILSIIFVNNTTVETESIKITVNDGSNDISILGYTVVPKYGTFVFNDKFVLEEDDDLDIYNGHTDGDWYVSYVDQDWT